MASSEEKPPAYIPPHRRRPEIETSHLPSKEKNQRTFEFSTSEYREFYETSGFWLISCDYRIENQNGLTELDRNWAIIKKMFDEGFFTKVTCFTAAQRTDYGTRMIKCFIPDYRDLENIIPTVAELRRRLVDYPYTIYLKTSFEARLTYTCCVDGDLYALLGEQWTLLRSSICSMSH